MVSVTLPRLAYIRVVAVLLFAAFWAAPATAQPSFTIDQVLSAPFPSDLTAASSGSAVAWVQNAEGVRNIWVAQGPDFEAMPVTAYTDDDGQGLGDLRFTPDGQQIVFVRGGSPNRQGEHPNPRSRPDPPERALWVVPADGSAAPRRLAEGHVPAIASDGRIAFLKDGHVWSTMLGEDAEATPFFTIRGSAGHLRWSPNGDRLAFVSSRGDHSFIGVYTRADSSLHYLDPSVDQDRYPVWSPDGTQIAFIRVPHEKDDLPFMPEREALPWSIRVADAATGEGRQVWQAAEGPGSAFQGIVAPNQLFWGAGNRIVFPWERTGWLHLYAVPVDGASMATHLTPGDFEVQHVTMTPGRQAMVYASNQDDINRRHLWRVPVTGGSPAAVTSGDGIEWAPAVTGDGSAIAFLASSATEPAHAEIIVDGGTRRPLAAASMPDDFPSDRLVTPEAVQFTAADGMRIHGQLFRPSDLEAGARRPAVVFFHGGSRRQMLLGFHYRGYYHNAYALNQYLANLGYIVLSVNYRSGIGYGLNFREALNYGARGASEFNDVLGAGLYLQSRSDVDSERIGLWGGSYGGYLTALGLARASDLFASGVDIHGVHDWNVVIENFVPSYDPAARAEAARLAHQSSPMAYLDGWTSPVLLIHGDDDRNVPFSETVDLVEQLRTRDVPFEQLVFPDEVHGFLLHENWLRAYRATADFFDRTLRSADE
jgi:dipeptidyl aminopeptidase/acylaminoacyl peptidase